MSKQDFNGRASRSLKKSALLFLSTPTLLLRLASTFRSSNLPSIRPKPVLSDERVYSPPPPPSVSGDSSEITFEYPSNRPSIRPIERIDDKI